MTAEGGVPGIVCGSECAGQHSDVFNVEA